MRATGLGEAGRFEEAGDDIAEARRLADALHDERLMAEVALGETLYHYFLMQLPQLKEAGGRAVAGLREAGALWNLTDALTFLDVACVFQGHFAESDELNRELDTLAHRIGHLGAQVIARRNRIPKVTAQSADLALLDEMSLTQANVAPDMGTHWVAYANTQRGIVHFWQGDWAQARTDMEEGVRLAFPGFWYGIHHGFLFLLLAASGERDAADGLFESFAETLPRSGRGNTMGAWCLASLAAEGVGVLGDVERARLLHPLVAEDLARGTVIRQYDGALLQRAAAMAAAAAALPDRAEEHFETALRQAQELPHLMERPAVRHFYARFLVDRGGTGDLARARYLLEEAVTGYRHIGMPRHETMAQQLLAACGASADRHQGTR
jgi:tetratricopeptide (TPR) repeat protein